MAFLDRGRRVCGMSISTIHFIDCCFKLYLLHGTQTCGTLRKDAAAHETLAPRCYGCAHSLVQAVRLSTQPHLSTVIVRQSDSLGQRRAQKVIFFLGRESLARLSRQGSAADNGQPKGTVCELSGLIKGLHFLGSSCISTSLYQDNRILKAV